MSTHLKAEEVHPTLRRFMLADGFEAVLDLKNSRGSWLVDAKSGERFLDFFTCFASWPIGYHHPLLDSKEFKEEILEAATHNPSNADLYSVLMGEFVKEFGENALPPNYHRAFFISGGTLGVENALKAAFDWKIKINQSRGITIKDADGSTRDEVGQQILHFREAFHGRSGYTLSLTNTSDARKTALFPKFKWPRVLNPKIRFPMEGDNLAATIRDEEQSIREIESAFTKNGPDIAAVILETIQCEGGDNHFRREFLQKLRELCNRHEAMLIFDEVQAGFFAPGKMWCFQHHGVEPDMVAFGKKTQVCGFFANDRIKSVAKNVFEEGSRINSTWGGNLADMTRSKWILRAILKDNMMQNILERGEYLVSRLRELGARLNGGWVAAGRGVGCLVAFDCPSKDARDQLLKKLIANKMFALSCGDRSIRFRPPLNVSNIEIDRGMEILTKALADLGVQASSSSAVR
ncbi:MAG: L-lysine 6-transaminase [Planctomycetes bacterium]|nr:L-lysine 6-transaminase [Planctomycetota bacterium]